MKISKDIIDYIICNVPSIKRESGGLLGADINQNIVRVILDKGIAKEKTSRYTYFPDIELFNKCIIDWSNYNICFAGIFHTHFANNTVLSDEDIHYIKKIIDFMPNELSDLYFPILLIPEKIFIPFVARLNENGMVEVKKDILEIIV